MMRFGIKAGAILSLALSGALSLLAQKDFVPDLVIKGSSMAGWHTLGAATWKVSNGQIEGLGGSAGGWLVSEKKFQDVRLYLRLLCQNPCNAGVLFRAEKTPDGGLKGDYVSLSDGDLNTYDLTVDAQGKVVDKVKLPDAPRENIGIPGPRPQAAASGPARPPRFQRRMAALAAPGDWNTAELMAADNAVNGTVNDGALGGGTVDADGYGAVAIHVGSGSMIHLEQVGLKDINAARQDRTYTSNHFTEDHISDFYYGWSAVAADVYHRGILDVVSGPFVYLGPDYTVRRRYREGRIYNPSLEYAPDMVNFAYDFTGDGWPDILASGLEDGKRPLDLYINPRGESRRWTKSRAVSGITTELVLFKDIDGDGKPEVIFGANGQYAYAKPDPQHPEAEWKITPISGHLDRLDPHGMGVGDINSDGRPDLVVASGWYEHPAPGSEAKEWTFHPADFGGGGGEIGIYDVNGDGRNDVVTSLAAHGFGLAWFEQKRDKSGSISFVRHDIEGDYSTKNAGGVTFSQPHAAAFADMDGDGIPDMVVGKSKFHHLESWNDPDPFGQPVLYVYRTVRDKRAPGGAYFVPVLVNNNSGVGSAIQIVDLNHDGANDILTQSVLGTFIFFGHPGKWPPPSAEMHKAAKH
jgi:3-keto-disaccharide hydrolase/FG-GAP-like repeat